MSFDLDVIGRSLPYLWKGFLYTLELTAIASLGGLFFGTLLALCRAEITGVLDARSKALLILKTSMDNGCKY